MSVKEMLLYLTIKSHQDKMRKTVSDKVSDILDAAEKVANSGEKVYFIQIKTPSQEVIDELISIGLTVSVDRELATVSWWSPEK